MTTALDAGRAAYRDQKWEEAVKCFSAVIDDPDANSDELHKVYSNRCAAYMHLNQLQKAKDDAESCTMSQPTWAKGHGRLGECFLQMHNYRDAIAAFRKANELEPKAEYQRSMETAQARLDRVNAAVNQSAYAAGATSNTAGVVPQPTTFIGRTLTSFLMITRAFMFLNAAILASSFTANQGFLSGLNKLCVRVYLVSAVINFLLVHGRPRFNKEFLQQVLIDTAVQRAFGGFVLYLGANTPALVAIMLPELAAFCGQVVRLFERMKMPTVASKITGLFKNRLLDAHGNVYWKVSQVSAYIEVAAGCYLLVGLVTPRRNFMQLIFWWQYLQMRYMLEAATGQPSGVLHMAFRGLDTKIKGVLPGPLKTGYGMLAGLLERQVKLPQPGDTNKFKCSVM